MSNGSADAGRPEFWTLGTGFARAAEREAVAAENAGWDGMLVVDSQNLAGDPFVGLTLAAQATSTLLLGTGVTNPSTRHPVATAAAIASIHVASGGRAVLGIGRGDSALAHLGLAPASPADLERYLVVLRAYLRGERVAFESLAPYHREGARPIRDLGLADHPDDSRLLWLDDSALPVPVEVAASGPKVLALAAANADRVNVAVGADPDRVAWAIGQIRDINPSIPIGAFVTVVPHEDSERAREIGAGGLATFARFSVMDGTVRAPMTEKEKEQLERLHGKYDMTRHTRGANEASRIDADFAHQFGILGPSSYCVERLQALVDLGIDRFVVLGASTDSDRTEARRSRAKFVEEVMPALRDTR